MSKPAYVILLERWEANGTLDVIDHLQDEKIEINVPRSDGSTSRGLIVGRNHAGLTLHLTFAADGKTKYKQTTTEEVIGVNPDLFVAEHAFLSTQAKARP